MPHTVQWTRRAPSSWRRLSCFLGATVLACSDGAGPSGPPEITIVTPAPGATFAGGDEIAVSLTGHDASGGVLRGSSLEWWVVLHHGEHTHPVMSPTPGSGAFTVPRQGHLEHDVFYRVYARAVAASGRADTTFVDVPPRLTTFTITTEPAGLQVLVDHQPRATPVSITSIVGMERALGSPGSQGLDGVEYEFSHWSDGAAAQRTLIAPTGDLALIATYREHGVANVAPLVAVSAPASGATLTVGTAVTLQADASDGDGTVTLVEFFVGGVAIGQDATAPYALEWTPAGTGSRTLTARATDDDGAYRLSSPVGITLQAAGSGDVVAPIATLTAPATGSLDLTGSVALTATASDNVGVTAVQFEVDAELIAVDMTAPYAAVIPSTSAYASGVHVVRARALDAAGNASDWSSASVTFGGSVPLPAGFVREPLATGFGDVLTAAALTPDGRLLVAEKSGRLRVVKDGQLLSQPFVQLAVLDGGERGLLGVAIHPAFRTNGYVYLYYTAGVGGVARNRISRFVANGDVAVASSEVLLAELPPLSDASKHNGGAMHFGPDGKLYVAVGDDGNGSNAASVATPFGKMLRFDADGGIPSDNPFLTMTTGINRAIWARGLRNPFTFAIEPGTGRMHINDVGAGAWEEVNLGRAGADYGWPATEGPTANPAYDAPILAYGHDNSPTLFDGLAVVGAAFYRPAVASFGPAYVGNYFFADYVRGWVYRLDVVNSNVTYAFAQLPGFLTGLLVSPAGRLFILADRRVDVISRP